MALASKAELVLGMLLVVRHRTMRLSGVLALLGMTLAMFADASTRPGLARHTVLLLGGSLGAVAGSRLLAPGAALAAAWRCGSPWWLPAMGRLAGVALLAVPTVGVAAAALTGTTSSWHGAIQLGFIAWVYTVAVAATALASSPFLGASVSGALGLLAVWFGGIPPSAMSELLTQWPYVQRLSVLLWNVLPLGWRARRWLELAETGDALLLATWIVLGVALGAWGTVRVALVQDHRAGFE